MNRPTVIFCLSSATWLTACPGPGDEGAVDDEIGDADGTEVETGDGDGDGDGCNSGISPLSPFPTVVEEMIDPITPGDAAVLCPDVGPLFGVGDFPKDEIELQIIRPGDVNGKWPLGRFPLLAFVHGNGQFADEYDHLWKDIVPRGVMVMNLDDGETAEPESRAARMLCALRWMQTQWPEADRRLGCSLGLAGHSNGAHGTYLVARHLVSHAEDPAAGLDLAVLIGLAPKSVSTMDFFPAELAPPYVALQGSIDNDVPGGAIRTYDIHTPEEVGIRGTPDKYLIWAYDVEHDALGGGGSFLNDSNTNVSSTEVYPGIAEAEAEEKGRVFATEYVSAAVRRFLLGDLSARQVLRGEVIPAELTRVQWWNYLPTNPDGRPMIFTSFVPSLRISPTSRLPIDLMTRNDLGALSPSSEGRPVHVDGFAAPDAVVQGWSDDIILDDDHVAQSLGIRWAEGDEGVVSWDLSGLPVSEYTHLSMRVANVNDLTKTPAPNANCMVSPPFVPEIAFEVEFEAVGPKSETRSITEYGFLPAQDFLVVDSALGIPTCFGSTFMQTIELPLADVCQELPLDELVALHLRFGAAHGSAAGTVLLDSLELHRAPELPAPCE